MQGGGRWSRRTPRQNPAGGVAQRQLHVGSFNIAGGMQVSSSDERVRQASIRAMTGILTNLRLDVILLQECFIGQGSPLENKVSAELLQYGFRAWFARPRKQQRRKRGGPVARQPRPCGGTAILVRESLIKSGAVSLTEVGLGVDDRSISATLKWGGHKIDLASHYLPSGQPAAQIEYIKQRLAPAATKIEEESTCALWGGDFNFVLDRDLDTLHERGAPLPRSTDQPVIAAWRNSACQHMADTFRAKRPTSRTISRANRRGRAQGASGARLDRIHASPELMPYITYASIPFATTSDHRVATARIIALPGSGISAGRKRFKLRTGYTSDPKLVAELEAWVEAELKETLPPTPADVPAWYAKKWPLLIRKVEALNAREGAARRAALTATAAEARLEDAGKRLERGEALTSEVAAAQTSYRAARTADALKANREQYRKSWEHSGEAPSPEFTAMMRTQSAPDMMPGVRLPSGELVIEPKAMAKAAIQFTAAISAKRPADDQHTAAAKAAVLADVRACHSAAGRLSEKAALALQTGGQTVTTEQMELALKRSPSGKSPGPDGIPLVVYKRSSGVFAGLLADIYSAFLQAGRLPPGFNEGLVVYIYKGEGDRTAPNNYRPITLLNITYRLLAKVLADVLNPALADIVDPAQTAFIAGRRIGDTIMQISTAQALLAKRGRWAMAVFADFTKAYDTIDRDFLFKVMEAMGVPIGFVAAARLLLTDTRAAAYLNGVVSPMAIFEAGIRQGCPLAPLLYLFVAEALLCVLRRRQDIGLAFPTDDGVSTATTGDLDCARVIAPQYADDVTPLVLGGDGEPRAAVTVASERLVHLAEAFDVFGAATNQRLNLKKTVTLPIGCISPTARKLLAAGSLISGFRVVDEARTLGVTFACGDGGSVDPAEIGTPSDLWSPAEEKMLCRVEAMMKQLGTFQSLSMIGRGLGTAAYAVSQILYHLEFRSLPPEAVTSRLAKAVAEACSDPGYKGKRRFYAIRHQLLVGRPADGGVGAMPWQEHLRSRHGMWAVRLLRMPLLPWAGLFSLLLRECHADLHPLGLFKITSVLSNRNPQHLEPLKASLRASRSLPLLVARIAHGARAWGAMTTIHPGGRGLGVVAPAGLLGADTEAVRVYLDELARHLGWTTCLPGAGVGSDLMVHLIPPQLADEERCACTPPGVPTPKKRVCVDISVSAATRLQLRKAQLTPDAWEAAPGCRYHAWAAFREVAEGRYHDREVAVGDQTARPPRPVPNHAEELAARRLLAPLFDLVWGLHINNKTKEGFYRLVYNGFKTSARLCARRPCPCDTVDLVPGRPHTFWACPVALAVRAEIQQALPVGTTLERSHVWLIQPPAECINRHLWACICLVAIAAMEQGRKALARIHLKRLAAAKGPQAMAKVAAAAGDADSDSDADWSPPTRRSVQAGVAAHDQDARPDPELLLTDSAGVTAAACAAAVKVFWSGLADCAVLNAEHQGKYSANDEAAHPLLRPTPSPGPAPAKGETDERVWKLSVVVPAHRSLPISLRDLAVDRQAAGPAARDILLARLADGGRPGTPLAFCGRCSSFELPARAAVCTGGRAGG